MFNDLYAQTMRQCTWSSMCRDAESNALLAACICSEATARMMMLNILPKFVRLPAPRTNEEAGVRTLQRSALSLLFAAIAHADSMARIHPSASSAFLAEAQKLCEGELPTDADAMGKLYVRRAAFSTPLSSICNAHRRVA